MRTAVIGVISRAAQHKHPFLLSLLDLVWRPDALQNPEVLEFYARMEQLRYLYVDQDQIVQYSGAVLRLLAAVQQETADVFRHAVAHQIDAIIASTLNTAAAHLNEQDIVCIANRKLAGAQHLTSLALAQFSTEQFKRLKDIFPSHQAYHALTARIQALVVERNDDAAYYRTQVLTREEIGLLRIILTHLNREDLSNRVLRLADGRFALAEFSADEIKLFKKLISPQSSYQFVLQKIESAKIKGNSFSETDFKTIEFSKAELKLLQRILLHIGEHTLQQKLLLPIYKTSISREFLNVSHNAPPEQRKQNKDRVLAHYRHELIAYKNIFLTILDDILQRTQHLVAIYPFFRKHYDNAFEMRSLYARQIQVTQHLFAGLRCFYQDEQVVLAGRVSHWVDQLQESQDVHAQECYAWLCHAACDGVGIVYDAAQAPAILKAQLVKCSIWTDDVIDPETGETLCHLALQLAEPNKLTIRRIGQEEDATNLLVEVGGLKLQRIPGNGCCLFDAIACCLQENVSHLRARTAQYLEEHRARFVMTLTRTQANLSDSDIAGREGLTSQENNLIQDRLRRSLPADLLLGEADPQNSFLDAVAQSLNQIHATFVNSVAYLQRLLDDFSADKKNRPFLERWDREPSRALDVIFVHAMMLCHQLALPAIVLIEITADLHPQQLDVIPYHITARNYRVINPAETAQLLHDVGIPKVVVTRNGLHCVPLIQQPLQEQAMLVQQQQYALMRRYNGIREENERGDLFELELIQQLTDRIIVVIDEDGQMTLVGNPTKSNQDPIFLYYNKGNYDALLVQAPATATGILTQLRCVVHANPLLQHLFGPTRYPAQPGYIARPVEPHIFIWQSVFGSSLEAVKNRLMARVADLLDLLQPALQEALNDPIFIAYLNVIGVEITLNPDWSGLAHEVKQNSAAYYLQDVFKQRPQDEGWVHPALLLAYAKVAGIELHLWCTDQPGDCLKPYRRHAEQSALYDVVHPEEQTVRRIDLLMATSPSTMFQVLTFEGYAAAYPPCHKLIYPYRAAYHSSQPRRETLFERALAQTHGSVMDAVSMQEYDSVFHDTKSGRLSRDSAWLKRSLLEQARQGQFSFAQRTTFALAQLSSSEVQRVAALCNPNLGLECEFFATEDYKTAVFNREQIALLQAIISSQDSDLSMKLQGERFVTMRGPGNNTALHYLMWNNLIDLAFQLVFLGADPKATNDQGEVACQVLNPDGNSLAHCAYLAGEIELVLILINKHTIDLAFKNRRGESLIHLIMRDAEKYYSGETRDDVTAKAVALYERIRRSCTAHRKSHHELWQHINSYPAAERAAIVKQLRSELYDPTLLDTASPTSDVGEQVSRSWSGYEVDVEAVCAQPVVDAHTAQTQAAIDRVVFRAHVEQNDHHLHDVITSDPRVRTLTQAAQQVLSVSANRAATESRYTNGGVAQTVKANARADEERRQKEEERRQKEEERRQREASEARERETQARADREQREKEQEKARADREQREKEAAQARAREIQAENERLQAEIERLQAERRSGAAAQPDEEDEEEFHDALSSSGPGFFSGQ